MERDADKDRDSGADGSRRAMRSEAAGRVYGRHSGYRSLRVYRLAEQLYDFTCRFSQAHWLAGRLLDRQARDFEAEGGFSERLHKARSAQRHRPPR